MKKFEEFAPGIVFAEFSGIRITLRDQHLWKKLSFAETQSLEVLP